MVSEIPPAQQGQVSAKWMMICQDIHSKEHQNFKYEAMSNIKHPVAYDIVEEREAEVYLCAFILTIINP